MILPACGHPSCQRLGIVHEGRTLCPDHLISVLANEKEILAKHLEDLQAEHLELVKKYESRDFEIASRAREMARGMLEKNGHIRLDLVGEEDDLTLQ